MKDAPLSPDDELRFENELKALNLELNYGARNFIADDAPPEVVRAFLENVARFEEAHANGKTVTVRQFARIGDLPAAAGLKEAELEPRIDALLEKLFERGVAIDRPDHLSPRGYYRFLTEDLLEQETTDQEIPGMIRGFIYDEIRHDSPAFIREHVEETLLDLLNLGEDFRGEWLSEHCRNQTDAISRDEALESIHLFRARYGSITPIGFSPEGVKRTEDAVYFLFGVAWEGEPAGGGDPERFEGLGVSQVTFEDGEWRVQGIKMPGFEF